MDLLELTSTAYFVLCDPHGVRHDFHVIRLRPIRLPDMQTGRGVCLQVSGLFILKISILITPKIIPIVIMLKYTPEMHISLTALRYGLMPYIVRYFPYFNT